MRDTFQNAACIAIGYIHSIIIFGRGDERFAFVVVLTFVMNFQVLPSAAISYFVYEFMKIVLKVEST